MWWFSGEPRVFISCSFCFGEAEWLPQALLQWNLSCNGYPSPPHSWGSESGTWCVPERAWKPLESPKDLVLRKLQEEVPWRPVLLEWACNSYKAADLVTSVMEAEVLEAAWECLLSLIQTQPEQEWRRLLVFHLMSFAWQFCASPSWGPEQKAYVTFSASQTSSSSLILNAY